MLSCPMCGYFVASIDTHQCSHMPIDHTNPFAAHILGERAMSQFKREPRYIVFKIKDLRRYCSEQTQEAALSIGDIIANGRRRDGKAPFNAVVVEQDWPEFEPTWAAIEARMKEGR